MLYQHYCMCFIPLKYDTICLINKKVISVPQGGSVVTTIPMSKDQVLDAIRLMNIAVTGGVSLSTEDSEIIEFFQDVKPYEQLSERDTIFLKNYCRIIQSGKSDIIDYYFGLKVTEPKDLGHILRTLRNSPEFFYHLHFPWIEPKYKLLYQLKTPIEINGVIQGITIFKYLFPNSTQYLSNLPPLFFQSDFSIDNNDELNKIMKDLKNIFNANNNNSLFYHIFSSTDGSEALSFLSCFYKMKTDIQFLFQVINLSQNLIYSMAAIRCELFPKLFNANNTLYFASDIGGENLLHVDYKTKLHVLKEGANKNMFSKEIVNIIYHVVKCLKCDQSLFSFNISSSMYSTTVECLNLRSKLFYQTSDAYEDKIFKVFQNILRCSLNRFFSCSEESLYFGVQNQQSFRVDQFRKNTLDFFYYERVNDYLDANKDDILALHEFVSFAIKEFKIVTQSTTKQGVIQYLESVEEANKLDTVIVFFKKIQEITKLDFSFNDIFGNDLVAADFENLFIRNLEHFDSSFFDTYSINHLFLCGMNIVFEKFFSHSSIYDYHYENNNEVVYKYENNSAFVYKIFSNVFPENPEILSCYLGDKFNSSPQTFGHSDEKLNNLFKLWDKILNYFSEDIKKKDSKDKYCTFLSLLDPLISIEPKLNVHSSAQQVEEGDSIDDIFKEMST